MASSGSNIFLNEFEYHPSHPLLDNKVQCIEPRRGPTFESLQELQMLALCTRSRISRDLLRVIAPFVIRKPRESLSIDVITQYDKRMGITISRQAEIKELVRLLSRHCLFQNLVHIASKTLVPRLMYCKNVQMQEMVSGPITLQQKRWLAIRTLEQAGVEDGDIIDTRYHSDKPLLRDELDPELELPQERSERTIVLEPNFLLISTSKPFFLDDDYPQT